jgi:hypothetical protein
VDQSRSELSPLANCNHYASLSHRHALASLNLQHVSNDAQQRSLQQANCCLVSPPEGAADEDPRPAYKYWQFAPCLSYHDISRSFHIRASRQLCICDAKCTILIHRLRFQLNLLTNMLDLIENLPCQHPQHTALQPREYRRFRNQTRKGASTKDCEACVCGQLDKLCECGYGRNGRGRDGGVPQVCGGGCGIIGYGERRHVMKII